MINRAYQQEWRIWDTVQNAWIDIVFAQGSTSCTASTWSDSYGWHHNNLYYYNFGDYGVYYIADFAVSNDNLHFGQYFWWIHTGPNGLLKFDAWWHLEFNVGNTNNGIAYNRLAGWTQITHASDGTTSYWQLEKFAQTGHSGHFIQVAQNAQALTTYHKWAAVNSPWVDDGDLDLCADGSTLYSNPHPWGAEYMRIDNLPASDGTSNHAAAWTEWVAGWSGT
jgi:hypothetical protein